MELLLGLHFFVNVPVKGFQVANKMGKHFKVFIPQHPIEFPCTPAQFFMGVKTCMGYVKMHGFHWNPLYDSQEWG